MPDAIAQSSAFEICGGGTCGDPQISADGKTVTCTAADSCSGTGCFCQVFKRDKTAAADAPWHVVALNQSNQGKHNPARNNYKCICVKPILPGPKVTVDGEDYATRYVLCGMGTCSMTEVTDLGPAGATKKLKCSGACADSCKCTMFRLEIGGQQGVGYDAASAKWERVAKVDVAVAPEGHYYYRCFCLKAP